MDKINEKKRRAELQAQYREMKFPMGVFQIKNNINGKIYIGSSMDLNSTQTRMKFEFSLGSLGSPIYRKLAADWAEYGEDNFSFEILEYLEEKADGYHDYKYELKKLREKWLEKLQPYGDKGYN